MKRTPELFDHATKLRDFGFTFRAIGELCGTTDGTIRSWLVPHNVKQRNEARRKWYLDNKEKWNECVKKWAAANPEKRSSYRRKSAAKVTGILPPNITPEHERELRAAIHTCELCGKLEIDCKVKLYLDHDHDTGRVRGLLCPKCNTQLGVIDKYLRDTDYRSRVTAYYAASL